MELHEEQDQRRRSAPQAPIRITWLGNASLQIEHGPTTLLIDPYISMPRAEHPTDASDFQKAQALLITHPHLDHLSSVSAIVQTCHPQIFGPPWACQLLEQSVPDPLLGSVSLSARQRLFLHPVHPRDHVSIGSIDIQVYASRHIQFDPLLVIQTLNPFYIWKYKENARPLIRQNKHYTLHDEIVLYALHIGHQTLLVMGSLGLDDNTCYPVGADILFLPYQGSNFRLSIAKDILRRLQPKTVIVTHTDDAFPPVSRSIPTDDLKDMVHREFPGIRLIIPTFKQPMLFPTGR